MNLISRTLSIPIWYDDANRIYVPTVDVPQGEWTVLLTLTPVGGPWSDFALPAKPLAITGVDFAGSSVNQMADKGSVQENCLNLFSWSIELAGKRLVFKFFNSIPPAPLGRPIAVRYSITICGYSVIGKEDNCIIFDPVIVAQPDPIYP